MSKRKQQAKSQSIRDKKKAFRDALPKPKPAPHHEPYWTAPGFNLEQGRYTSTHNWLGYPSMKCWICGQDDGSSGKFVRMPAVADKPEDIVWQCRQHEPPLQPEPGMPVLRKNY